MSTWRTVITENQLTTWPSAMTLRSWARTTSRPEVEFLHLLLRRERHSSSIVNSRYCRIDFRPGVSIATAGMRSYDVTLYLMWRQFSIRRCQRSGGERRCITTARISNRCAQFVRFRAVTRTVNEWMNEWKCNDFKCVRKPTWSRLDLTQHVNKSSRWAVRQKRVKIRHFQTKNFLGRPSTFSTVNRRMKLGLHLRVHPPAKLLATPGQFSGDRAPWWGVWLWAAILRTPLLFGPLLFRWYSDMSK